MTNCDQKSILHEKRNTLLTSTFEVPLGVNCWEVHQHTVWSLFLRTTLIHVEHANIDSTCLFTVTPKLSPSTWFYMFSFIPALNQHVRLSESVGNTEMRADVSSFVQKSKSPLPSYNPISHFPPVKM